MINADELYAMLDDEVGDELIHEQKQDLADALLKKYVIVKRPDVGTVEPLEGPFPGVTDDRVVFGGRVMHNAGTKRWGERLKGAEYELEQAVLEYTQWKAFVDFAEERESTDKHARREEIANEMGFSVYMDAPQTIKTLIARLVDEEFKNGRD